VSAATADDVRAHWGVEAIVAPHGPGQALGAVPAEPRGLLSVGDAEPRHLLYVGDAEPRKNLLVLLEAHARYRAAAGDAALALVLAGGAPDPGRPGVRVVPAPDAPALARLYAQAAALVHPSRHEGFGLTPLEAMAAGVPVVAAEVRALTETCAGAALFFDPCDPAGLAAALAQVTADATLRRDLVARGRARAARFDWAQSARAHLRAYTLATQR
jgi:glycosyltransferase involved in cell wall biosynthesis